MVEGETKTCCHCQQEKNILEFNKNKQGKFGRHSRCKTCTRKEGKEIYKRLGKNHYLLSTYGINEQELQNLFDLQNGRCAICYTPLQLGERSKRSACVDHCHNTGKVRGLLCNHCNKGLGMFLDNTQILASAITYLEKQK